MQSPGKLVQFNAVVLAAVSLFFILTTEHAVAQVTAKGGCDTYSPASGDTVTCDPDGSNPDDKGVQTPKDDTSINNVTVVVESGVVLDVSGSTIGLGAGTTVDNSGTLNAGKLRFGYGISAGINGRSTAGGNTFINQATGVVLTAGSDAHGLYINARQGSATSNTMTNAGAVTTTGSRSDGLRLYTSSSSAQDDITNSGSITTSGEEASGIHVQNAQTQTSITNSGTITVNDASSHGIYIEGAANVFNSGTIQADPSGYAIYVEDNGNTNANAVTLSGNGVQITGALRFSPTRVQEKLVFDAMGSETTSFVFNNDITGLNFIEVKGPSHVTMGSANGYDLVNAQMTLQASTALNVTGDIRGSGGLIKRGDGTLRLSGVNTYSGGTDLQAGTLVAASNEALGSGTFVASSDDVVLRAGKENLTLGNSILLTEDLIVDTAGEMMLLNGSVTGAGRLVKRGTGTLTLAGTNGYSGGTIVQEGTLGFFGNLSSGVTVQSGAQFGGAGTVTGDVTNAGTVRPRLNGSRTTLTIVGNYVGQDGTFVTTLDGTADAIEADRLVIQGSGNAASGTTSVRVADPSGLLGKPTVGDGILLVDVSGGANTTTTAFTAPRIAAGAYEYQLVRGGENSIDSWYLRADEEAPEPTVLLTPAVSQREEVALYPALPSLARQYLWSINGTLDDRHGAPDTIDQWANQPMAWGRFIAKHNETTLGSADKGPGIKADDWGLQLGVDLWRVDTQWGQWRAGPVMTIGRSTGGAFNSSGSVQTGDISLNAYSLGLNATVASDKGAYADLFLLGTRLAGVEASSRLGTSINTTGWALSGSIEGGWRLPLTEKLAVTPQAQIYTTTVNLRDSQDAYSLVQMPTQTTVLGRMGIKLSYDNIQATSPRTQFWARASVYSTIAGKDASTSFLNLQARNATHFQSQAPGSWAALEGAVNIQASESTQVQIGMGYQSTFDGQYVGVHGQISMRMGF